jgi:excisionase family DNA binding protein
MRQTPLTLKMLVAAVIRFEIPPGWAAGITRARRAILHKVPDQWTPEFISVGFIAKGCGVSNTTVLRWISTGQLPAFRLPGGHYRIERNDFSEFLAKHSIPAANK